MNVVFQVPSCSSLAALDAAEVPYEAEPRDLFGIVSPRSQNCWPGLTEDHELHCFTLAAWKTQAGEVDERELTVLRPVPPDSDVWGVFPPFTVFALRVLLSVDQTRAILMGWRQPDAAVPEMTDLANELRSPVVAKNDALGLLVFSRTTGEFVGLAERSEMAIRIGVAAQERKVVESAAHAAAAVWADLDRWLAAAMVVAVEQLLPVKNSEWRAADERPVSAILFRDCLRLESLHVAADGRVTLRFDADDLFDGHLVEVEGELAGGPQTARVSI